MDNTQKTGFTKTGFSKAGFAACSHWQTCELGKLTCHYAEIDPEVMEYCFCYQRNHSIEDVLISEIETKEEIEGIEETKKEQLSLF